MLNGIALIHESKMSRLGCYEGDKCTSVLIYVDDTILLSLTRYGMQEMLDKRSDVANDYGLRLIHKNVTLSFGVNDMGNPLQTNDTLL